VCTPPFEGGGYAHRGVTGQRVEENEPAGVLVNGNQEGLLKGRQAVQHAGTARGGG
jgi:hypothetical protein